MARYSEEQMIQAFQIYSTLAAKGQTGSKECRLYMTDADVRSILDIFVEQVDCTLFAMADESLILLPLAMNSPFHVTNESIKREYFTTKSVNMDIYMMYIAIIVLFGEFYDSYQTQTATRLFLTIQDWLTEINERISYLSTLGSEQLEKADKANAYNWMGVCEKWEALNDIREGVRADARSISRLSFLNTVSKFLEDQKLIQKAGFEEIELTEKAQQIVGHYFMNQAYNRGLLSVLYPDGMEQSTGEATLEEV